jgi:hypothetical protein
MSMKDVDRQLAPDNKRERGNRDGRLILLSRLVFGLSSAVLTASLVLYFVTLNKSSDTLEIGIGILLAAVANGVVGLVIIRRYPGHAVGWLLLLLSLVISFVALGNLTSVMVENGQMNPANPLAALIVWTSNWVWYVMVTILIIFIPLFFPDGQLLSKRWRLVALAGMLGTATGIAGLMIAPDIQDAPATLPDTPAVALAGLLAQVATPLTVLAFLGAVISVILRYRRSGQVERAQMKWVLFTILLGIIVTSSQDQISALFPATQPFIDRFSFQIFLLFSIALPVVIGIAILRYRLYDIDLIIRRTVVYGLVSLALLLVYFGSVVLLQQLFTGATGESSPLAIVISTLLIAALFNPLRRRVQDLIDRRFYRQKYDAQQVLTRFAKAMRDETDKEALTADLHQVVQETLQPETVYIWFRQ